MTSNSWCNLSERNFVDAFFVKGVISCTYTIKRYIYVYKDEIEYDVGVKYKYELLVIPPIMKSSLELRIQYIKN